MVATTAPTDGAHGHAGERRRAATIECAFVKQIAICPVSVGASAASAAAEMACGRAARRLDASDEVIA